MPTRAIDQRVKKSVDLYNRAEQLIPGKTQLISRRSRSYADGVSPIYAKSAKGSRFVDVDGNEYIDWVNAVTAIILGHADDVVDNAVKEQIDRGSLYTLNSPMEIELAEVLCDIIPSCEMVRYTKGGGEACAVAVRIARGTTGRDKIAFCGYHGWHDWYQAANFLADPTTGQFPFAGIEPLGVPKALAGTAIPFAEGDIAGLEKIFKDNKGEIAAVMMEPMRSFRPKEGYLEKVKEIAHKNGALLIFDEVSSGWRISLGGAQEWLGVTPDMSVFAKAMSNGYPMGVVVGSRESMQLADRMFISSSYWSDNIGLAASVATIGELKRRDSTEQFKIIGEKARKALEGAIASVGIKAKVTGLHIAPTMDIEVPDPALKPKVNTLFIQEMARRGIFCPTQFKATLAHTDEDIRITADVAEQALKVVRRGLEGELDRLLEVEVKKEPFRRLVS
ncbi:MAG: aminotransferase class III-fold pyridoxal phosphate-dependent enzyme [SAR202 cluster bacterium]|nr:aminotransferase class III-fold pyridoxal phosphate-dependent enzyme [SAR202 cluster bacterium]